MSYPSAPTLPSATSPTTYTVHVNPSPPPIRPPSPTSSATMAFYGSKSVTSLNRARSMSSATDQSAREPNRERSNSIRSTAARSGHAGASSYGPTDRQTARQYTHPYSYPRATHSQSGISVSPPAATSLQSLQSSRTNLPSQTHTSSIPPRASFFRPQQSGVSTLTRLPPDRISQPRPPSDQVSPLIHDQHIPLNTLGRRPSGRSALSSRATDTGLATQHSRKRERVLEGGATSGYQSDGYLSDGPRSGYNSDGARSGGYQSDGAKAGYNSDTGRSRKFLPIGVAPPLSTPGARERERDGTGLNRRSWDTRWLDGVETLGIGRGPTERRNEAPGYEEKNIGWGMVVPGEEGQVEPLSPQEPARSQFDMAYQRAERPNSIRRRSVPGEGLRDEDDRGARLDTRPPPKQAHFAPLPPPPTPPQTKKPFSRRSSSEKARIPLSHSRPLPAKNYESHPSRNSFYLGGRILTGGDAPWPFVASFVVVLAIAALWLAGVGVRCGTTWGPGGWAILAVGCYGIALVIASMLVTAFMDPGILPRDLDPDPPYATTSSADGSSERVPLPRDLRARSGIVRVKYCSTCKTYRPPRSSHCKVCDNCVDGIDHHCTYLHNCVGRRNYTTFVTFLVSSVLTLCLVIITSALELWQLARQHTSGSGFKGAVQGEPLAAVSFALSIIVIWPVSVLLAYHVRLQVLNVTTVEQVRAQAHRSLMPGPMPPNAFTLGTWHANLADVLCRPSGYGWLQPTKRAEEDTRLVNPGWRHRREADDDQGRDWGFAR